MLKENFSKSGLIAGLLALSSSAVLADPALLETNAKVRSGPGMQFSTLTVLPGGSTVDVTDCGGRWCAVAYGERQGYVARSLLDFEETVAVVQAPPQVYASAYATYPAYGAYIVGPIYADYYSLTAYGPYGAWPAPSYSYYRDYYFRPGPAFGVGLGF
jgi:uncharacterized protein YraI